MACDLATDYAGRCIVIACALTILERLLLTERPAFFVTAGQRGGGKTTTVNMVSLAVLGFRAAAAAWSPKRGRAAQGPVLLSPPKRTASCVGQPAARCVDILSVNREGAHGRDV
jgi:hypothetical protein